MYDRWRSARPVPVPFQPHVDVARAIGNANVSQLDLCTWISAPPISGSCPAWAGVLVETDTLVLYYFSSKTQLAAEDNDMGLYPFARRADAVADILAFKVEDGKVVDADEEDAEMLLDSFTSLL